MVTEARMVYEYLNVIQIIVKKMRNPSVAGAKECHLRAERSNLAFGIGYQLNVGFHFSRL